MERQIVKNMTGVDETETISELVPRKKISFSGALHPDKCSCNMCKHKR